MVAGAGKKRDIAQECIVRRGFGGVDGCSRVAIAAAIIRSNEPLKKAHCLRYCDIV
jgi:hypothetical protein